jgi:MFS family permease
MDMIRLVDLSFYCYMTVFADHALGCHQWNLDQSGLHQDLPADQGFEHPRHHSELLLCTEDPYLLKTSLMLIMDQLGNLLGCLLTALFGEHLGRKNTLRVGAGLSTIGAILQFSATTFPQLIVGRVINGTGNGMFTFLLLQSIADTAVQALLAPLAAFTKPNPVLVRAEVNYRSSWCSTMSSSTASPVG